MSGYTETLSDKECDLLKAIILGHTEDQVRQITRMSPVSFYRAAAGLPVRAGTAALIRQALGERVASAVAVVPGGGEEGL